MRVARLGWLVAATTATVVALGTTALASDAQAQAARTDVLLLVDTTGSMSTAIDSAVAEVAGITERVDSELGDVAFAVAEVRDYPIAAFGNEGSGDSPYSVAQPITTDRTSITNALEGLFATGGGDGPESYGRALLDADVGAGLGWRPGANRMVILVADNVPHDTELNEGIPADLHASPSPFDTLADPGSDSLLGTGDDIDWQPLLDRLAANGLPLMLVLFEGIDEYLPYWEIWAGRTGGAAARAGTENLADTVVDLARRGAAAKLPPCPAGQSRDSARRCRPYSEWLGYSFKNAAMANWASAVGLSRDDILTEQLVKRTFRDVKLPSWWSFWSSDPRHALWHSMDSGTCFGMALSGGRFSTGLEPLLSPADQRAAGSWGTSNVPGLPGPSSDADGGAYRRELLQTLATDFISQLSTQVQASFRDQRVHFANEARAGRGATALRTQLDTVMATGRSRIGSLLGSERPSGLATIGIFDRAGHAVVAFGVRDQPGGGFQIDVWDNNQPGKVNWIPVAPDGSWSYGPLGWSGKAGDMVILPQFRARGLNYQDGGKSSSGRNVTVVDVPAQATILRTAGRTSKGEDTAVTVQPPFNAATKATNQTVVTDGSGLSVTLKDRDAGATARGNGVVLGADGLTGGAGKATIAYDTSDGSVSSDAPRTGRLTVTRGDRSAASSGASTLELGKSGEVTATARSARTVTLVLSSLAGRPGSATLTLRVPRKGSVTVGWKQAARAIRRGGSVRAVVRAKGRRARALRVAARSVARSYDLRARIRVRGRRAALVVGTDQALPRGTRGRVSWRVSRGGKTLRRATVDLRRVRTGRPLARIRLPKGRLKVQARVRVAVTRPGPAELTARASRRVR